MAARTEKKGFTQTIEEFTCVEESRVLGKRSTKGIWLESVIRSLNYTASIAKLPRLL
jgi:hypothetical protein